MTIDGYTPEVFLKNYKKDSEVFGPTLTQYLYEEIFSTISGTKVSLNGIQEIDEETINETAAEDAMLNSYVKTMAKNSYDSKAANIVNNIMSKANMNPAQERMLRDYIGTQVNQASNTFATNTAADVVAKTHTPIVKPSVFTKLKNFFTTMPAKVKVFFGGLQGKSFGEIMKGGLAWLQANPALALKTTGGLVLLAIIIKALKKRNKLKNYKNLAKYDNVEECINESIDNSVEKIVYNKVLKECETNKALRAVMLG